MATRRILTLLLLLLLASCALPACRQPPPPGDGREPVTINGETFRLDLAADETTRVRGLMHRASIPADGGMLFVFPESDFRSFWMAYCLVDMDIIFLDAKGRVTATHRMKAQPPQQPEESLLDYENRLHDYAAPSVYPAQFAIELKAGSLDRLDVEVEDVIPLDLPRLKALAR